MNGLDYGRTNCMREMVGEDPNPKLWGILIFFFKNPKNTMQVKMEGYLKNSKKKKGNYPATWSCGV